MLAAHGIRLEIETRGHDRERRAEDARRGRIGIRIWTTLVRAGHQKAPLTQQVPADASRIELNAQREALGGTQQERGAALPVWAEWGHGPWAGLAACSAQLMRPEATWEGPRREAGRAVVV